MITETDNNDAPPQLSSLLRKTLVTGMGALRNRGELFAVEWDEEKSRLIRMVLFAVGALFLGMMGVLLLTGTIIFLVPEQHRLYAALGFAVLYLGATIWAVLSLKALLKQIPFGETLKQFSKDRDLLDAIK